MIMQKYLIFFILAASLFFTVDADAADSGIIFKECSGEVLLRPDNDPSAWELAAQGKMLRITDHVRTQRNSSATLLLNDDIEVELMAESKVKIDYSGKDSFLLSLYQGTIIVRSISRRHVEIRLSQCVAGIKASKRIRDENVNFVENAEAALKICDSILTSTTEDQTSNLIDLTQGDCKVLLYETKEEIELQQGDKIQVDKGPKVRFLNQAKD